jgi:hypothetical protein
MIKYALTRLIIHDEYQQVGDYHDSIQDALNAIKTVGDYSDTLEVHPPFLKGIVTVSAFGQDGRFKDFFMVVGTNDLSETCTQLSDRFPCLKFSRTFE